MPSLTFLGAAGTVTGSKRLIDLGDHQVQASIVSTLGWPVHIAGYLERVALPSRAKRDTLLS